MKTMSYGPITAAGTKPGVDAQLGKSWDSAGSNVSSSRLNAGGDKKWTGKRGQMSKASGRGKSR